MASKSTADSKRDSAREHARLAAGYLITEDYSNAATEAHRAYQDLLVARALEAEVVLRG